MRNDSTSRFKRDIREDRNMNRNRVDENNSTSRSERDITLHSTILAIDPYLWTAPHLNERVILRDSITHPRTSHVRWRAPLLDERTIDNERATVFE